MLIGGVVLASLGIFIFMNIRQHQRIISSTEERTTSSDFFDITTTTENKEITFSGFIQPIEEVSLHPEVPGRITHIFVSEGAEVKRGEKLFQLENTTQRLGLQNAQVAYQAAKLQLEKMKEHNNTDHVNSGISRVSQTQESLINSAKNTYLNTDLRAYPEDVEETEGAPLISGNYNCTEEGVYVVNVYGSSALSGASFQLTGLEQDTETVSINYTVPLGTCGLEILFPSNFSKNAQWFIPVPNTRSAQAIQAKKQYESAITSKDLALKQSSIDSKDIAYQERLVSQAALGIEVARRELEKTTIQAPVEGKLETVEVDVGLLATPGTSLGRIISEDFEFVIDVPVYQRNQLSLGQEGIVTLDEQEHEVFVSGFVDDSRSLSQSKTVKFGFVNTVEFIGGEVGIVTLELPHLAHMVPRAFVGFGYDGPFVVCDDYQALIQIYEEDEESYWIDFKDSTCEGRLLLPHKNIFYHD